MKTASFLFISAALHAAALAYPALHSVPEKTPPLVVSLLEAEGGGGGGEKSPAEKAGGARAARSVPHQQLKRVPAQNATPPRAAKSNALAEAKAAEFAAIAAPPEPVALPVVETQAQSVITLPVRESAVTLALESGAASSGAIAATGSNGASRSPGADGGRGTGSGTGSGIGSGVGSGAGSGQGSGSGDGNGAARFVQASYMSCPKADYPEAARRQGWEGTVTIEVAIDEEGRPKSSRVQRSSGFAVLDGAALDNIQRRCRFYPARRGEMHVATLIRIPVEFRLGR